MFFPHILPGDKLLWDAVVLSSLHGSAGPPSVLHFCQGWGPPQDGLARSPVWGVSVEASPPWCPAEPFLPWDPEGPCPHCMAPGLGFRARGASQCCAHRCPFPLWWPCSACGSGSPCPSSTWVTTSASVSSRMTTPCAPTRFPGRFLSSGGT